MTQTLETKRMTEEDMVEVLRETVEGGVAGIAFTETFADAGVLTYDKGLVIQLENGQSFYITVQEGK